MSDEDAAPPQQAALTGVRVLDLTQGPAGGLATMILADFGAEVLAVQTPDENPFADLPARRMWQRGKAMLSLTLEVAADRERFEQLCAGADVLVTSRSAQDLARYDLTPAALRQRHPGLVCAHITGFGNTGSRAGVAAYEHVAAALSGRMQTFAGIVDRPGPVFSALQVGTHATAQSTATGVLAALFRRNANGGSGCLVETSLLQGMLPYEQGPMIAGQFERFAQLYAAGATPEPPMPSLFYHPAQAGDGQWLQFGNLLPHLFDNFLLVTELMDVVADADFDAKQLLLRDPAKHEAFRERMLSRIQARDSAAWVDACIDNGGVVATRYQTTQQALEDPDIVANGHVIETAPGERQLGPLARLTATPAQIPATPEPASAIAASWTATPRPTPVPAAEVLPLQGVKVLEIATIIAAPLGASFLADAGADVTKIEQIGGDPYRGLAMGVGSARVNAGKRSVSVNLKSPEGQAIVQRLAQDADILIHNFRPGVPERLGLGYETLAAANPRLVYLQSNGYGPDGPGAQRPSTHPIPGAAMGGVYHQFGERVPLKTLPMDELRTWTRRLMRANEVNPDPNTALVIATACLLGLNARDRTGRGQRILVDMFGANAYANADDFLHYPDKAPRRQPDPELLGLSPTYRLYQCAQESWLFVALLTGAERARFADTVQAATIDRHLLDRDDDTTAAALSALFTTRHADEWDRLLSREGLGCVRADGPPPSRFWLDDEHSRTLGLTAEVTHPAWGTYRRHGPNVFYDGNARMEPPPTAGQHNETVLADVGMDATTVQKLIQAGVLWTEALEDAP